MPLGDVLDIIQVRRTLNLPVQLPDGQMARPGLGTPPFSTVITEELYYQPRYAAEVALRADVLVESFRRVQGLKRDPAPENLDAESDPEADLGYDADASATSGDEEEEQEAPQDVSGTAAQRRAAEKLRQQQRRARFFFAKTRLGQLTAMDLKNAELAAPFYCQYENGTLGRRLPRSLPPGMTSVRLSGS